MLIEQLRMRCGSTRGWLCCRQLSGKGRAEGGFFIGLFIYTGDPKGTPLPLPSREVFGLGEMRIKVPREACKLLGEGLKLLAVCVSSGIIRKITLFLFRNSFSIFPIPVFSGLAFTGRVYTFCSAEMCSFLHISVKTWSWAENPLLSCCGHIDVYTGSPMLNDLCKCRCLGQQR